MLDQLNRLMALLALCGLLIRPVMAMPDGYQTLVVDGDTLVVQMAEPLPAGYQTIVVGGDTLTVQVLAEPLPTDEPPLAASDDSLSAQKRATEISPQSAIGDSANTTEEPDHHFLNSVFMDGPFQAASAVSDSAERVERFPVQAGSMDDMDPDRRVAQKLTYGALWGAGGGAVGAAMGFALGSYGACSDCDRDGHDGCDLCGLGAIVGSLLVGSIGCSIGTAVGVSRADPHDLFGASLIGSVVGLIGGIWLVSASESELLFPSLLIGPIVGATLASEWSRSLNPSGKKLPLFMNLVPDLRGRFSVGLVPAPKGGLSAIATLRF